MTVGATIYGNSATALGEVVKNIQIIDRAENATFSIFQATDEEFDLIFIGDQQDMEFIEDFLARVTPDVATSVLTLIWERFILKRDAQGIHGTLYYEYESRRRCLPVSKREVDWAESAIDEAQRRLFASRR